MLNIAVLVSGGGTNLGALLKAEREGKIKNGKITKVISSRPDAYALERAKSYGVPTAVVDRKAIGDPQKFDDAVYDELEKAGADLIVLAGFLYILSGRISKRYENKIINVHPALIPSFCGPGYYGLRVHEAALKAGVKITGATVHFVNEVADGGPIILQGAVEVKRGDTPETLQKRVMEEAEWKLLPKAVSLICEGRVELINGRAYVKE